MGCKKIMVIDDDKEFLVEVDDILKVSGCETRTFTDGEEGIQGVFEYKPDVVLLDLKMGGKDGLEVADELKNNPKTDTILIIIITAFFPRKN